MGDDVRRAVTVLCRGPRRRWVTALAVLAGLITMGVGTAPYHVVAPAVVKPARVHHVTAPFDGRLVDSHVVAGDRVEAGAVLCRLDDAVLQLDRADLVAQIDVLERRIDRARSESHPGDAAVLASERRVLEARLRGVDQRIGDCVVRAPHDGIVIEGDLRERIGAVVERGAPFFRIATDRAWLLEVRIPERDVEELSTGLGGTFALNARPTTRHDLEVTTVSPFLTVAQRRNVCMAEARVALDDGWVRPGMEGVARIDVGRRRLWWIAAHRLLDRACLAIWF